MDVIQHIKYVESVLGRPAQLVGGAVRDTLMGVEPKDLDFCTAMQPDDIEAAVRDAGRKPYTTGKRFGTIGFKSPDGKDYYEVTTYRTEGYDGKSRKPEVEFVSSLKADLSRRDFTINAMAMSRGGNSVIVTDPFGGMKDLREEVIRCVGEPTLRFKEDPLRMVRACRFASQLGFNIDPWTYDRMKKNAYLLTNVSVERVCVEVDKILMSARPGYGLLAMWETGLFGWFIPELQLQYEYDQKSPYHMFPLHEHTIAVVEESPHDLDCRWLALLHDIAKPFCHTTKIQEGFGERQIYALHDRMGKMMGRRVCEYLRFSNARTDFVSGWVGRHQEDDCPIKEADDKGKGV